MSKLISSTRLICSGTRQEVVSKYGEKATLHSRKPRLKLWLNINIRTSETLTVSPLTESLRMVLETLSVN
jgi:hypothetical protein